LAIFAEDDDADLVVFGEGVVAGDAFEDGASSLDGFVAGAEAFAGEEGSADGHDEFAVAGGGGCADVGVDVEALADDGESPTRPGSLKARPEVVQPPARRPWVSMPTTPMVSWEASRPAAPP